MGVLIGPGVDENTDPEDAEYVVCMRVEHGGYENFPDNVKGVCSHCGKDIYFRPHVPKKPPKVCIQCASDTLTGGHA